MGAVRAGGAVAAPHAFRSPIPFAGLTHLQVPDAFKRTELAWKLSIQEDNPILRIPQPLDLANGALQPTGFEPYLLGSGQTAKQIITRIATIGAEQLDALARKHHDDEYYVARLLAILKSGHVSAHDPQRARDIQALAELDAILGALTRWLGGQAEHSDQARAYREETHEYVDPFVRTLEYSQPGAESVVASYALPDLARAARPIAPKWSDLPTLRLRRGWRFMALLGDRLGNAPVRVGLQGLWLRLPLQYRY